MHFSSVSGRRESNPHQRLGKPLYYHCTTTAKIFISLLLRRIGFKHPDKTFYHQCKIFCLYSVINYVITALDIRLLGP